MFFGLVFKNSNNYGIISQQLRHQRPSRGSVFTTDMFDRSSSGLGATCATIFGSSTDVCNSHLAVLLIARVKQFDS
jgi:hypothetical protein